jgi:thioredoxin reductase (NADPH)
METASVSSSPRPWTRVVIVGAGPIGLELAVTLRRHQIPFEIFDAGTLGQAIVRWAPETRWFSSNDRIAIAGVPLLTPDQSKATREQYLTYLRGVAAQFAIHLHCYQPLTEIRPRQVGFTVATQTAGEPSEWDCEAVVLAIGGLDRPRRLGIEGEDLPHVAGRMGEPHQYFGRKVLIIGGRNSAVEAALRLYHVGAEVSLSYRHEQLPRDHIKYWLLPEIEGLIRSGHIKAYFGTRPSNAQSKRRPRADLRFRARHALVRQKVRPRGVGVPRAEPLGHRARKRRENNCVPLSIPRMEHSVCLEPASRPSKAA